MSYADELRAESRRGHSVFHEFILALAEVPADAHFAFYEGDEDASFYAPHILRRLGARQLHSFICNGRTEVLKANELTLRDGRCSDRALFFIDKDHSDIVGTAKEQIAESNLFQTRCYAIENYLVSEDVLREFWVQRLHLSSRDPRLRESLEKLRKLRRGFQNRSRILMAIVLFGRGIDSRPVVKLNLNNVQLDRIFDIDLESQSCVYAIGAGQHFLGSTNMLNSGAKPTSLELRTIYRRYLKEREPQSYIRGKYELWFFWKILTFFTRDFSDREKVKLSGMKRATPTWTLSLAGCVESLASLLPCPRELSDFLDRRIVPTSGTA
ncbi:DUF4435 domain-containing protein [Paraburkholderia sabiae]|uniref:DUF4435 domain-containing protein n=1 Tax=Paraburkholderia sabiae TaxID=273251 RepID=A0ABU9QRQ4_9BURK|nr:DUF4435 domain-containing protein [Paraburkholderia sabiae]WJZ79359.1 DUF4435 domain-containing protein [Paraburkholderia sabiae]CAD6563031.1 hypothetical protein LMG24235_08273 [Paraburkholderia sabiae]